MKCMKACLRMAMPVSTMQRMLARVRARLARPSRAASMACATWHSNFLVAVGFKLTFTLLQWVIEPSSWVQVDFQAFWASIEFRLFVNLQVAVLKIQLCVPAPRCSTLCRWWNFHWRDPTKIIGHGIYRKQFKISLNAHWRMYTMLSVLWLPSQLTIELTKNNALWVRPLLLNILELPISIA